MKNTSYLIFLLIILSCSNPKNDIPVLNFEKAIDNPVNFDLGKYINNVRYVPLETNRKCCVGAISNVLLIDRDIYLTNWDILYKFTSSGKFMRQIGQRGRGPAEFDFISDISYNVKEKLLCLSDNGDVVKYDTLGVFNSRIAPKDGKRLATCKVNSKGMYFYKTPHARNAEICMKIYGKDLSLQKEIHNSKLRKNGFWYQAYTSMNNDCIYYNSFINDTIFCVDNKLNNKAAMIINRGKYRIPDNKMVDNDPSLLKGYFITKFFVANNLTIFNMRHNRRYAGYMLYFDKQNKVLYPKFKQGDEYLSVQVNGLEWRFVDCCKGKVILSIDAIELLDNYDEISDEKLKNIAKRLTEDSNPVLAVVEI